MQGYGPADAIAGAGNGYCFLRNIHDCCKEAS
jgi:hypothetical protein